MKRRNASAPKDTTARHKRATTGDFNTAQSAQLESVSNAKPLNLKTDAASGSEAASPPRDSSGGAVLAQGRERGRVPSQRQILKMVPQQLKEELDSFGFGDMLMGALSELFVQLPAPAEISPALLDDQQFGGGGGKQRGGSSSSSDGASTEEASEMLEAKVSEVMGSTLEELNLGGPRLRERPEWSAVRRLLEAVNPLWCPPVTTIEVAGEQVPIFDLLGFVPSTALSPLRALGLGDESLAKAVAYFQGLAPPPQYKAKSSSSSSTTTPPSPTGGTTGVGDVSGPAFQEALDIGCEDGFLVKPDTHGGYGNGGSSGGKRDTTTTIDKKSLLGKALRELCEEVNSDWVKLASVPGTAASSSSGDKNSSADGGKNSTKKKRIAAVATATAVASSSQGSSGGVVGRNKQFAAADFPNNSGGNGAALGGVTGGKQRRKAATPCFSAADKEELALVAASLKAVAPAPPVGPQCLAKPMFDSLGSSHGPRLRDCGAELTLPGGKEGEEEGMRDGKRERQTNDGEGRQAAVSGDPERGEGGTESTTTRERPDFGGEFAALTLSPEWSPWADPPTSRKAGPCSSGSGRRSGSAKNQQQQLPTASASASSLGGGPRTRRRQRDLLQPWPQPLLCARAVRNAVAAGTIPPPPPQQQPQQKQQKQLQSGDSVGSGSGGGGDGSGSPCVGTGEAGGACAKQFAVDGAFWKSLDLFMCTVAPADARQLLGIQRLDDDKSGAADVAAADSVSLPASSVPLSSLAAASSSSSPSSSSSSSSLLPASSSSLSSSSALLLPSSSSSSSSLFSQLPSVQTWKDRCANSKQHKTDPAFKAPPLGPSWLLSARTPGLAPFRPLPPGFGAAASAAAAAAAYGRSKQLRSSRSGGLSGSAAAAAAAAAAATVSSSKKRGGARGAVASAASSSTSGKKDKPGGGNGSSSSSSINGGGKDGVNGDNSNCPWAAVDRASGGFRGYNEREFTEQWSEAERFIDGSVVAFARTKGCCLSTTVRWATKADSAALVAVNQVNAHGKGSLDYEASMRSKNDFILVAERGGQVVGFVQYYFQLFTKKIHDTEVSGIGSSPSSPSASSSLSSTSRGGGRRGERTNSKKGDASGGDKKKDSCAGSDSSSSSSSSSQAALPQPIAYVATLQTASPNSHPKYCQALAELGRHQHSIIGVGLSSSSSSSSTTPPQTTVTTATTLAPFGAEPRTGVLLMALAAAHAHRDGRHLLFCDSTPAACPFYRRFFGMDTALPPVGHPFVPMFLDLASGPTHPSGTGGFGVSDLLRPFAQLPAASTAAASVAASAAADSAAAAVLSVRALCRFVASPQSAPPLSVDETESGESGSSSGGVSGSSNSPSFSPCGAGGGGGGGSSAKCSKRGRALSSSPVARLLPSSSSSSSSSSSTSSPSSLFDFSPTPVAPPLSRPSVATDCSAKDGNPAKPAQGTKEEEEGEEESNYLPFAAARALVRQRRLLRGEWPLWRDGLLKHTPKGARPFEVPAQPDLVYRGDEKAGGENGQEKSAAVASSTSRYGGKSYGSGSRGGGGGGGTPCVWAGWADFLGDGKHLSRRDLNSVVAGVVGAAGMSALSPSSPLPPSLPVRVEPLRVRLVVSTTAAATGAKKGQRQGIADDNNHQASCRGTKGSSSSSSPRRNGGQDCSNSSGSSSGGGGGGGSSDDRSSAVVCCRVFDSEGKEVTPLEGGGRGVLEGGQDGKWGLKVLRSFEPLLGDHVSAAEKGTKKKKSVMEHRTDGGGCSSAAAFKTEEECLQSPDRDEDQVSGEWEDGDNDEVALELDKLQAQLWALEGNSVSGGAGGRKQKGTVRGMAEALLLRVEGEAAAQPLEVRQSCRSAMCLTMRKYDHVVVAELSRQAELKAQQVEDMATNCAVCQAGEVGVLQQIVFCEYCNVAVHQQCYGVGRIPDGDWFCTACTAVVHLDELTEVALRSEKAEPPVACALCPAQAFKAGAVLPTDEPRLWVHSICADVANLKARPINPVIQARRRRGGGGGGGGVGVVEDGEDGDDEPKSHVAGSIHALGILSSDLVRVKNADLQQQEQRTVAAAAALEKKKKEEEEEEEEMASGSSAADTPSGVAVAVGGSGDVDGGGGVRLCAVCSTGDCTASLLRCPGGESGSCSVWMHATCALTLGSGSVKVTCTSTAFPPSEDDEITSSSSNSNSNSADPFSHFDPHDLTAPASAVRTWAVRCARHLAPSLPPTSSSSTAAAAAAAAAAAVSSASGAVLAKERGEEREEGSFNEGESSMGGGPRKGKSGGKGAGGKGNSGVDIGHQGGEVRKRKKVGRPPKQRPATGSDNGGSASCKEESGGAARKKKRVEGGGGVSEESDPRLLAEFKAVAQDATWARCGMCWKFGPQPVKRQHGGGSAGGDDDDSAGSMDEARVKDKEFDPILRCNGCGVDVHANCEFRIRQRNGGDGGGDAANVDEAKAACSPSSSPPLRKTVEQWRGKTFKCDSCSIKLNAARAQHENRGGSSDLPPPVCCVCPSKKGFLVAAAHQPEQPQTEHQLKPPLRPQPNYVFMHGVCLQHIESASSGGGGGGKHPPPSSVDCCACCGFGFVEGWKTRCDFVQGEIVAGTGSNGRPEEARKNGSDSGSESSSSSDSGMGSGSDSGRSVGGRQCERFFHRMCSASAGLTPGRCPHHSSPFGLEEKLLALLPKEADVGAWAALLPPQTPTPPDSATSLAPCSSMSYSFLAVSSNGASEPTVEVELDDAAAAAAALLADPAANARTSIRFHRALACLEALSWAHLPVGGHAPPQALADLARRLRRCSHLVAFDQTTAAASIQPSSSSSSPRSCVGGGVGDGSGKEKGLGCGGATPLVCASGPRRSGKSGKMSFSSTAALMSAAAPPLSASSSPSSAASQSSSQPCPCPSLEVLALLGADLRSILHPPSSSSPSPSSSSSAPSVFPRIGAREAWAVSAVLRAAYEAHPAGPPLGDKRATPLKNCKHCGQGPVSTLADTTAHTSSLAKHKGRGGGGGGALRCCPDCKSWSHPTCDGWSLSPCERGKQSSGSVGDGGEKSSHTMTRDGVAAACDFDMAPRDSAMLRCRSCHQAQVDAAAKSASRAAAAKTAAARLAANAANANAVSTLVAAADQAAAAMATYSSSSSSSSSSHYLFSPQLPSPSLPVSGAGATQSHHPQPPPPPPPSQQQQQSFLGGEPCSTNGSCFPPKHSQQTNGPSQLRAAPSLGHPLPPPPTLHPHAPPTAQFYDQQRGQGQNVQQQQQQQWYYQEHQARSRQQPHHPHQSKQQQQQQQQQEEGNSCLGRQRTDWPETGSSSSLTSESAAAEFTPSATTVGAGTRRPASSASPDAGTKRRDGNCEDGNGNNHNNNNNGQKSGFVAHRVPFARAFTAGHGLGGHEDS